MLQTKEPNWVKNFAVKNWVLVVLGLFCAVVFITDSINNRLWMNDFKVYYLAATDLLQGGQMYGKGFGLGSGVFKYAPVAAVIFMPFALLPYAVAKSIYFLIISAALCLLFSKLKTLAQTICKDSSNKVLFIVFAVSADMLFRELHLGNINLLLLLTGYYAILFADKNRLVSGLLLALVIVVKPHFVVLLPLLVLRQKFKVLGWFVGFVIAALFVPALVTGWQRNLMLLDYWTTAMQNHSNTLSSARHTFAYILQTWFWGSQSVELYLKIEVGVLIAAALGVLLYVIRHLRVEMSTPENPHFQYEFFLLMALVPTLAITDTEHFLLSIPLITVLVARGFSSIRQKPFYVTALVLALLCFGANIHDLVGATLSDWLSEHSFLGIGNAGLIVLFMVLMRKS